MNRKYLLHLALTLLVTFTATAAESELLVKSGDRIVFLGDSITSFGAKKRGFIGLVMGALPSKALQLKAVPVGRAGNKSTDMHARIDESVISQNADWMVLSCGVNDVWHFTYTAKNKKYEGVSLDDYKKNIRQIIEKAEAAGIKVMILTATMIGEDPERETNKKLAPYNEFLRELAKEKNFPLADVNQDMHAAVKEMPDVEGEATMFGEPDYQRNIKNKLTTDGVHLNWLGNIMMAKGILKAFGMSESKIAAAEKGWLRK
jgi:lysophospholipase L1-like esterase